MDADRLADQLHGLARDGLAWTDYVAAADQLLGRAIDFDRSCWHTVDPGTVLLTGSVNREVSCSGSWLAEFEYVVEDVNKWSFLARSGRLAGSTSQATHGTLTRSARHRSQRDFGIGDELRGSMVDGDGYWAAVGLLRDDGRAWFADEDVALLAGLSAVIAVAARRALVSTIAAETMAGSVGPGVVTFDADGRVESLTPAAEQWIGLMTENPPPDTPGESKVLQAVAARARKATDGDPLETAARARLRAADGTWLLLYGSRLSGGDGRTVVVIQQASPSEVAPLVALAYGLTPREVDVTRMCIAGLTTKEIAARLHLSAYTVQDHLKAIFEKTGVRSRGALLGQVFLEHYIPRWQPLEHAPEGWHGYQSRP
ncbi:helix-turn-helix transcriptional regulator [Nocardioides sp. NBC_00163]|uniref:helix-turn-helix domain-containing protein n=1 Tax=unclassified Nocardioides TaxID=2615069 RepID=UPI003253EC76